MKDLDHIDKDGLGVEMTAYTGWENKDGYKDDISDNDDREGDDEEENWTAVRVCTSSDIMSKSILCDRDDCELSACILWKSSKGKCWKGCIDCQRDEFSLIGEWPIKEKLANEALKDKPLMLCIYRHCKAEKGKGILVSHLD